MLQLAGYGPCKDETPQAEAYATKCLSKYVLRNWLGVACCISVFKQRVNFAEQIRAVPPRLFQGLLQAPAANLFVISAKQDFRHAPTAKFRGTRVVGAVEENVARDPCSVTRDLNFTVVQI